MKNEMTEIGIQPIVDIVALTLQTGFVGDKADGLRPASLLLIAKPESGKTTTISKYGRHKFVYYADEITSTTIIHDVIPQAQGKNPTIRFVVIPDILNSIEKSTTTKMPLLNTLKSMTDEGITKIKTAFKFHPELIKPVKCGLISAITSKGFYDKGRYSVKHDLARIGFLSRMIPFSYRYPITKVATIYNFVIGGITEEDNTIIERNKVIKRKIRTQHGIKIYKKNPDLFRQLIPISEDLGKQSDSYGIRVQKNLQKLCYANAYMHKRDKINQEDIDKILDLSVYMNMEFKPMM